MRGPASTERRPAARRVRLTAYCGGFCPGCVPLLELLLLLELPPLLLGFDDVLLDEPVVPLGEL